MTKRILIYGDSNTWGLIPNTNDSRYSEKERYPMLLQKLIGPEYEVIEEGLDGRTLTSIDSRPGKEGREGNKTLLPIITKHEPLDLVVLMLGTNELNKDFNQRPHEIARMLETYYVKPLQQRNLRILIISPPLINEQAEHFPNNYEGAEEKSKELATLYYDIARKYSCFFIDGSKLELGSDGVHLSKNGHYALANMLYGKTEQFTF